MNKSNTAGISQHSTTGTLSSKTSDRVRQISLCATNGCNSTALAGRLIAAAENLDPTPDIFMIVAILELTQGAALVGAGFLSAPEDRWVHRHGIYALVRHVTHRTVNALRSAKQGNPTL